MFRPELISLPDVVTLVRKRLGLAEDELDHVFDAARSGALAVCERLEGGQLVSRDADWANTQCPFIGGIPEWALVHLRRVMVKTADIDRLWPEASVTAAAVGARAPAAPSGGYISPFITLMLGAVQALGVSEATPRKHEELCEYFLAKRTLPDGTRITPNLAKSMATLCRPSSAMSGGNRRIGG